MIFLTVGSELPFTRLVKAVDQWCGINKQQKVFAQIGPSGSDGYRPINFEWEEFVSPREYHQKYNQAELIIAHAGMGSIITALEMSKPIFIRARLAALHEARNDHQVATANRFSERKGVIVADDECAIVEILDQWDNARETVEIDKVEPYAEERLIRTIREFILSSLWYYKYCWLRLLNC